jgi:hypothetical protein
MYKANYLELVYLLHTVKDLELIFLSHKGRYLGLMYISSLNDNNYVNRKLVTDGKELCAIYLVSHWKRFK